MEPDLALAHSLFSDYLPADTVLTIEENPAPFGEKYLFRLVYRSNKSGRTMCVTAKGSSLPTCDDECLRFYVRQLVLDPQEARVEFARIYWREKNARQQMFLSGELGNIRVSDIMASQDKAEKYGEILG